jgi:DnaJ-class molecular chaperone
MSLRKLDLYKILSVNKNSSVQDIKKAYKKLALKYHPDKNKEDNSNERFIEIKYAYDILSNVHTRKEYDSNSFDYKFSGPSDYDHKIFDFLNKSIFFSYLKSVTTNKNYLNLIEIIYSKFKFEPNNSVNITSFELFNSISTLLDIEYTLEFTLKEVYNYEYKKVSLDRITKNKFIENIYPVDLVQIYEGEGELIEMSGINIQGNIKIKIKITSDNYLNNKYYIIKNDLYLNINKDQIKNNNFTIDFLDGQRYSIGLDDIGWEHIDIGKIFKMENKGMCYYNSVESEEYVDFNNGLDIQRGDVYFIFLL